jgi:hypothetical protein
MTNADLALVVYERHGGISNKEASVLVDIILSSSRADCVRGSGADQRVRDVPGAGKKQRKGATRRREKR